MKITILAVGKVKEKFYRQAIEEFEKRLSRYCKLEIIEVADEKTPDHASRTEEIQIKEKEGKRLMRYLREDAWVCVLSIEGKMLDSLELSEKLENLGVSGVSHMMFVIGGSLGLSESVQKQADFALSFSKNDLSAPVDAGDFAGADLSKLPDYVKTAVS